MGVPSLKNDAIVDTARSDGEKTQDSLEVNEEHVLQARTIGVFGAISLVVNKIVGAGIFSTPSTIFNLSGSVGMALMIWVIGGMIATCGALVMLELGTSMPRSGGMKVYLERTFSPKLLVTCVYMFYCVFLQVSASNAITTSSYLLQAADVEATTWRMRGLAVGAAAFAVGVHIVWPRLGRALQDLLSVVKLFTLFFIVCTGFAALAGHRRIPDPHNFDVATSFKGTSDSGYNIGTALLNAIFAYGGYDNVLSEVKNPRRTLRIALPTSMALVTVLYVLANIAYFAAVPKEEFIHAKVTIASAMFKNVFGESAGTRALPALVAISALGHLLGIAFTVPRVIQELGKDGIAPFPSLVMQNRPFKTPIVALLIHLGVTILFICAPPAGDAFNFVVKLSSYPTTVLSVATTIGLIKLRLRKPSDFQPAFKTSWAFIVFYLAGNIFLIVMPFVRPPKGSSSSYPYWLVPVVALAILALGFVYYALRFMFLPYLFRYRLNLVQVELSDGSQVRRYKMDRGHR
ncbi:methionine permease [Polychaeton citri CBS 116435]|uniref:Methionine permease n=1 Tax=Polychaeton citri CBS 116435 TaxID=1314669 RepID=A0A9P4QIB0_9PEZI|nr:methionine permease [Polychaeton citri CBS 116435]